MSRDPATPAEPRDAARADATLVLEAPSPAEVREVVAAAGSRTRLMEESAAGLVLGVSEVVTNALAHGTPPVGVVVLARPDRVEVLVRDAGPGPDHLDVAAARSASCPVPSSAERGRGLWLAFHSCGEVEVTADGRGCAVRLVAHAPA